MSYLDILDFLIINRFLIFLINTITVYLVFLVLRHNYKEITGKIFFVMAVFMLIWVDCAYIARQVDDMSVAERFLKIAWFATPMLFTFISLFVVYLTNKPKKINFLNISVFVLGVITSLITGLTHFIIKGSKYVNGNFTIIYGPLMYPFLGVILVLIMATLYPLFERYAKGTRTDKDKIIFFLIGLVIFYIANFIFNITLPIFIGIVRLYYFGDYSTIFLLSFTAYAILKHRLIDIKVVATELLTFTMWVAMAIDFYLTSDPLSKMVKLGFFAFMVPFGVLLIRGVYKEVETREKMEHLANKLAVANNKLRELDKAKSDFVTIASHQLRTPITAIKGYSSMLLEGSFGKLPVKAKTMSERILISSNRLIVLINDFLNLSRIERGKMQYDFKDFNLAELTQGVFQEFEAILHKENKKGIKISLKIEKGSNFNLNIDGDKIRQVISNLIDNAIKYSEGGFVKISLSNEGGFAFLKIKDSGIGISKENINKLFEKFGRADSHSSQNANGSGLGLFVAKEILKAHKGEIWAESKGEGKGSTFLIKLPIKK